MITRPAMRQATLAAADITAAAAGDAAATVAAAGTATATKTITKAENKKRRALREDGTAPFKKAMKKFWDWQFRLPVFFFAKNTGCFSKIFVHRQKLSDAYDVLKRNK